MKAGPIGMTEQELVALPLAVDIVTAGRALGVGRTKAHELVRSGDFPCQVLPLGHTYRVTKVDLLRTLGLEDLMERVLAAAVRGLEISH
ncbi:hypothetical protein [Spongiactinospora sp. TRM90649]|uniref:hypothetical protein n=1 Tax=Spongiactinospora sp. TRM90649 TaxID=3031114 RepID=UPI0023F747BC|nr:hypothetical protein [Spongiactinospora sp. TRM90649]MDF5755785.1 hypothetical protein [Spongiactinospora sp. TRM90649]